MIKHLKLGKFTFILINTIFISKNYIHKHIDFLLFINPRNRSLWFYKLGILNKEEEADIIQIPLKEIRKQKVFKNYLLEDTFYNSANEDLYFIAEMIEF